MSSIFVPELAISQAKNKFPAVFEKAVTRLDQPNEHESIEAAIRSSIRTDDAVSCIANREEEIWTVWLNLCKAYKI